VLDYLGGSDDHGSLAKADPRCLRGVADTAIHPLRDVLGLDMDTA
jgi:hypothetical protein